MLNWEIIACPFLRSYVEKYREGGIQKLIFTHYKG